jgi:chromosome partitioning protein
VKTISVVSQKGGSGKSFLSVHLAVALEELGFSVVIFDLDPQASSLEWDQAREAETPVVADGHPDRLPVLLKTAMDGGTDIAMIDTPPHSDQTALAAIKIADLILVPTRPRIFDLRAVGDTTDLLKAARRMNRAVVALNAVPARGALADQAQGAVEGMGLAVAPARITDREAFAHALTNAQGITEYEPKGKAAEEVRALARWLAGQLGLTVPPKS